MNNNEHHLEKLTLLIIHLFTGFNTIHSLLFLHENNITRSVLHLREFNMKKSELSLKAKGGMTRLLCNLQKNLLPCTEIGSI